MTISRPLDMERPEILTPRKFMEKYGRENEASLKLRVFAVAEIRAMWYNHHIAGE